MLVTKLPTFGSHSSANGHVPHAWIAASIVGCKDSVNIYESVYTSVDDATKALVPYLFHTEAINVKHLQRQAGGADCGLFAIH